MMMMMMMNGIRSYSYTERSKPDPCRFLGSVCMSAAGPPLRTGQIKKSGVIAMWSRNESHPGEEWANITFNTTLNRIQTESPWIVVRLSAQCITGRNVRADAGTRARDFFFFFLIHSHPASSLTARVYRLSIHVPRTSPLSVVPLRRARALALSLALALGAHGDSSLLADSLVSGSGSFSRPFFSLVLMIMSALTCPLVITVARYKR